MAWRGGKLGHAGIPARGAVGPPANFSGGWLAFRYEPAWTRRPPLDPETLRPRGPFTGAPSSAPQARRCRRCRSLWSSCSQPQRDRWELRSSRTGRRATSTPAVGRHRREHVPLCRGRQSARLDSGGAEPRACDGEDMSLWIKAAIAIEDQPLLSAQRRRPRGDGRAAVANIRAGEIVEGRSTITQQLVRNLYISRADRVRGR